MNYKVRKATAQDLYAIYELYRTVGAQPGDIARTDEEVTMEYIAHNLHSALDTGVCFVVQHPDDAEIIVAELHCYKLQPKIFDHMLSELTVAVHPEHQGKGLGQELFTALIHEVKSNRPEILRIELTARESNTRAIALYEKIGFVKEGRMVGRVRTEEGGYEADIPMGWGRKV